MLTTDDWRDELEMLRTRGVTLARGLSNDELRHAESLHRFRFPPDLRALLSRALPIAPRFPDWRNPDSPALGEQLAWPIEGIVFDVEQNVFWWDAWGPRPGETSAAVSIARAAVARAPRLIPVFGHRYLPAGPEAAGNPVLSVYQTDVIHYGADLRRYLACEFGGLPHAEAIGGTLRRVPFWSDLVESNT